MPDVSENQKLDARRRLEEERKREYQEIKKQVIPVCNFVCNVMCSLWEFEDYIYARKNIIPVTCSFF